MAKRFEYAVQVVTAARGGDDRAAVIETAEGIVVAVADGAGRIGNAAIAAEAVIDAVREVAGVASWAALLSTSIATRRDSKAHAPPR
ncbi:MAG: hypothetical protein AB7O24_26500 [Kofleriaceae bacterium]